MGLPFALRAPLSQFLPNILHQRGVERLQEPPPPAPYHHTLTPLTNSEPSVTHFVVLTTERDYVESEAYSVRV